MFNKMNNLILSRLGKMPLRWDIFLPNISLYQSSAQGSLKSGS